VIIDLKETEVERNSEKKRKKENKNNMMLTESQTKHKRMGIQVHRKKAKITPTTDNA
jgi:hypothetical protein